MILDFITKYKKILIGAAVVVVLLSIFSAFKNGNGHTENQYTVERQTLKDVIRVAGRVVPVSAADLGFEKSGIVSQIYVDSGDSVGVGQIIASLSNDDLQADVTQARADRDAAKAQLQEVYSQDSDTTQFSLVLQNAKESLESEILSALTTAQNSVYNDADTFFANPRSAYPGITFAGSYVSDLNDVRVEVGDILEKWERRELFDIDESLISSYAQEMRKDLSVIAAFLSEMADVASRQGSSAGTPEATVIANTATLSGAQSDVVAAISSLSGEAQAYRTTQLSYSQEDVTVQQANLASKEAALARSVALYEKTVLRSPISGVVNTVDIEIGESVSAQGIVVSVISATNLEVEGNVSELDVARVKEGDAAYVTLDAYGSDVEFPAHVSQLDPGETFVDDLPVYGIKVSFDEYDPRVRSGMTANVFVTTGEKENVLVVPEAFILKKEGLILVDLLVDDEIVEQEVELGERGNGFIEILSGLSEGDIIVLPDGNNS